MPFNVVHETLCRQCPFGVCLEDRRDNPVRGRRTLFRLRQNVAMSCTFEEFVPGSDNDPHFNRTFDEYLSQFRSNAQQAGQLLFPAVFDMDNAALAKVEGDVFELVEAAALWNAASVWNHYMDSNLWTSTAFELPAGAVPTPTRKIAIVKLPRGYDTTRLFRPDVRRNIQAHEQALRLRGMEVSVR